MPFPNKPEQRNTLGVRPTDPKLLGQQTYEAATTEPHEEAVRKLQPAFDRGVVPDNFNNPAEVMQWTAFMVRDGKEAQAREDMAARGFKPDEIEASFMPVQLEITDRLEQSAKKQQELKDRLSTLRTNRRQRDQRIAELRAQQPTVASPGLGVGDVNITQDEITMLEQQTEDEKDRALGAFGEISAAVENLSPGILGDVGSAEYEQAQDAAVEAIQTWFPELEVGKDPYTGLPTINGELIDYDTMDWINANMNDVALMAGGAAGYNLVARGLRAAGMGARTISGPIGWLSLGAGIYTSTESQKADRRRNAQKLGVFLDSSYEKSFQAHDLWLGAALFGVTNLGSTVVDRTVRGYRESKKLATKAVDKGKEKLQSAKDISKGEQVTQAQETAIKFGTKFLREMATGGVPVRPNIVSNMKHEIGLHNAKAFEENKEKWVRDFLLKGDRTEVHLNELGSLSPFAKLISSIGIKGVVKPTPKEWRLMTEPERDFVYMLYTQPKAIKFLSNYLKNNPNLSPEFLYKPIAKRTAGFHQEVRELGLTPTEAYGLERRIMHNTAEARQVFVDVASPGGRKQPIETADLTGASIPDNLANRVDVDVMDLVREYEKSGTREHQKAALEELIVKHSSRESWNLYKNALQVSERGIGLALRNAKTEGEVIDALIKYNNRTQTDPDWNVVFDILGGDFDRTGMVEMSIITHIGRRHTQYAQGDVPQAINWQAAWNDLKGVTFRTPQAQAHAYGVQQHALMYTNDVEALKNLQTGFVKSGRGASGGIGKSIPSRVMVAGTTEMFNIGKAFLPTAKAYQTVGVENAAFRVMVEDPLDTKSWAEFVGSITPKQRINP